MCFINLCCISQMGNCGIRRGFCGQKDLVLNASLVTYWLIAWSQGTFWTSLCRGFLIGKLGDNKNAKGLFPMMLVKSSAPRGHSRVDGYRLILPLSAAAWPLVQVDSVHPLRQFLTGNWSVTQSLGTLLNLVPMIGLWPPAHLSSFSIFHSENELHLS